MKIYNHFLIIVLSFLIVGCGGNVSNDNYSRTYTSEIINSSDNNDKVDGSSSNYSKTQKVITIDSNNQIDIISNVTSSKIVLDIASPKDIYLVVTSHFNNQDISIKSSNKNYRLTNIEKEFTKDRGHKLPINVLKFRENVHNLLHKNPTKNSFHKYKKTIDNTIEGVSKFTFCTDMDNYSNECTQEVSATARKVLKNIPTKWGDKNLIIWVADDEYISNNNYFGTINQNMVDSLAEHFLQNSDNSHFDDDIYDWVSNIYGQEWGSDANEIDYNLIPNNDTIEILIYNMHTDGLAGYFWPKDNFIKSYVPASNEKIMFYVNSQLYSNNEKETFSTLAHEFQHMIHFYQRTVKLDIQDPIWFDEMMSEATEDLLAVKLKYKGPRNVPYNDGSAGNPGNTGGRYPYFNEYNYFSLTNWYDSIINYYIVSSFGAYLIRNYDGAKLLHKMMYSEYSGKKALLDASGVKDFNSLLNKWGAGVILSDKDNLDSSKPRYNFGDFIVSSYGNIYYKIGSINFFNYIPSPVFKANETLDKDANLYYKVGENLYGKINLNISLPKGGDITIIAK